MWYVPLIVFLTLTSTTSPYFGNAKGLGDSEKQLKTENLWKQYVTSLIEDIKESVQLFIRYQKLFFKSVPRKEDRSKYLKVFPNSFALVRRLTKVWPRLRTLMASCFGGEIKTPQFSLNTTREWMSAVHALVRLQEVYNITTHKLANSELDGAYNDTQLTAGDCFDVGVYYRNLKHPWRAVEWLQAALDRAHVDDNLDRQLAMQYLYLAQCFKGDARNAFKTLMHLFEEYPDFIPAEELKEDYQHSINTTCKKRAEILENGLYRNEHDPHNVISLKGLCRKENHKISNDSQLRCRLIDYQKQHLKIAPFKMEELHLDPPVLLFHDVIHDGEIDLIKRLFHQKMRYAVYDYGPDQHYYQNSQNVYWISYEHQNNSLGYKFYKRSAAITNMELMESEYLLVASYGLGAEIKPHHDLGPDENVLDPVIKGSYSRSDYISLSYYLNDVIEGGYTLYPDIDLAVVPVKGAALMWFNRWPNMSYIREMMHSSCPVLQGEKWILTKWLHVVHQDFPKCVPGKETSFKHYYLENKY